MRVTMNSDTGEISEGGIEHKTSNIREGSNVTSTVHERNSVSIDGDNVVSHGTAKGNSSNVYTDSKGEAIPQADIDTAGLDEVMQSIKTPSGRSVLPKDATPQDLITIEGQETTIAAAVALGYLRQNPVSGEYFVDNKQIDSDVKGNQLETTPEPVAFKNDADEQVFNKLVVDLDPNGASIETGGFKNSESLIQVTIANGELDKATLDGLAGELGLNRGELQEDAERIIAAFEAQVADLTGKEDYQAFKEWASTHDGRADAMTKLALQRDTSAMQALVKEFKASQPVNIQALQAKGHRVFQDKGYTFVEINGNNFEINAARKAGII